MVVVVVVVVVVVGSQRAWVSRLIHPLETDNRNGTDRVNQYKLDNLVINRSGTKLRGGGSAKERSDGYNAKSCIFLHFFTLVGGGCKCEHGRRDVNPGNNRERDKTFDVTNIEKLAFYGINRRVDRVDTRRASSRVCAWIRPSQLSEPPRHAGLARKTLDFYSV